MSALLGNHLSLDDLIVVHMCGSGKDLNLKKTQEYLGLTITDNGHGRAFVKKVKSNDTLIEELIKPGDHIAAINAESTVGLRHYEVAKAIRELPEKATFTLHLIEPRYSEKHLGDKIVEPNTKIDNTTDKANNVPLLNFNETNYKNNYNSNQTNIRISNDNSSSLNKNHSQQQSPTNQPSTYVSTLDSLSSYEDLVNSSLPIERLLSRGAFTCSKSTTNSGVETSSKTLQDSYRTTIEKINSILESFLGINDNLLAIQVYRLAKENRDSLSSFSSAIQKSELNVFNFDRDIENHLWNCAIDDLQG